MMSTDIRRRVGRLPRARRRHGVLLALLVALSVLAACVLGGGACGGAAPGTSSGPGRSPGPDEVRLMVTQDFGSRPMLDVVAPASPGLNVMVLLADNAKVKTDYGGGFVSAIDGVESTFRRLGAEGKDWFYWVDGRMGDTGATSYPLEGGETVWWDYHQWANAMAIPWCLDAVPRWMTAQEVRLVEGVASPATSAWLASLGMQVLTETNAEVAPSGPAVVVVDSAQVADLPWVVSALQAGSAGGVFITITDGELKGLAADGGAAVSLSAAAVVLSDPESPERPILLVVVRSEDALGPLFVLLTKDAMAGTIGVGLLDDGAAVRLPVERSSP